MDWNEMIAKRNELETKDTLTREEADTLDFLQQRIEDLATDVEYSY
jgi:hypothetical protein